VISQLTNLLFTKTSKFNYENLIITHFIISDRIMLHNKQKDTNTLVKDVKLPNEAFKLSDDPQMIIYKTKKDYNKLVPVLLSKDKSKIVSFPDPSDVYYDGKLAFPTELINGCLLDNRGINNNVAFLRLSYKEYSNLDSVPDLNKLYSLIIDTLHLVELYNCGNKYIFESEDFDMNTFIKNNGLKKCK